MTNAPFKSSLHLNAATGDITGANITAWAVIRGSGVSICTMTEIGKITKIRSMQLQRSAQNAFHAEQQNLYHDKMRSCLLAARRAGSAAWWTCCSAARRASSAWRFSSASLSARVCCSSA